MKSDSSALWSIAKAPLRRKCPVTNDEIKTFQECK